jgi:hypothetical protein
MSKTTLSSEHLAKLQAARFTTSTDERLQNLLSQVEPTRRPSVKDRALKMPPTCQIGYLRAAAAKAAPAAAIKAHCLECVGYARDEVTQCTAKACPLFAYRPFQK